MASEMHPAIAGIVADQQARTRKRPKPEGTPAERKAAREAKAADRERERAAVKAGIARCALLAKKLPAEYQTWGYVRTRAWTDAAKVCAAIGRRKTAPLVKIETAISNIERVATVDLKLLAEEKATARTIKAATRGRP